MTAPPIHGKHKVVTASMITAALGEGLSKIKHEDRLTWADLGVVLGRSEDQAAKYAEGSAEMGVFAFYRAKQAFNGRFTGLADKLIEHHAEADAHRAQSCIIKAALAFSIALEDGELSVEEIRANRSTLENARDEIDKQLARLTVRAA